MASWTYPEAFETCESLRELVLLDIFLINFLASLKDIEPFFFIIFKVSNDFYYLKPSLLRLQLESMDMRLEHYFRGASGKSYLNSVTFWTFS